MMTIKIFSSVSINHTCNTMVLSPGGISLSVVDGSSPSISASSAPATTCERRISNLTVLINQTQANGYNSSLNLVDPFYVWAGYPYNILINFLEAGPINFNLTFTSATTNVAETPLTYAIDYPLALGPYQIVLQRTLSVADVYMLEVNAYNTHNLEPDPSTGLIPGGIIRNVTILALYPVSPTWTVSAYQAPLLNEFFIPNNTVQQFMFTDPNGATWPFPTNATVTIDWGDGNLPETLPFLDTVTHQPIFSHSYSTEGYDTITCSIQNAVSAVKNVITSVTIEAQIVGFTVTNGYFATPTSTIRRSGFGKLQNQYPMDKNLSFFPTVASGTVEKYTLLFTNNNSVIATYIVPNKFQPSNIIMQYYFGVEALVNLTVVAANAFEKVSTLLFIEIVNKIVGLEVDDYSIVTAPGNTKSFYISFVSVGGGTCMAINYGDSLDMVSMGEAATCTKKYSFAKYDPTVVLDTTVNVSHTYITKGMYNITVFAYNDISNASATLMFVVTTIDCRPPTVSLIGQVTVYLEAPTMFKGKLNFVSAIATVNCTPTQTTKKRWQIFAVDALTGYQGQPILVMNIIPSWNQSGLVIPAAFLSYGYYMCLYTITMWDPPVLDIHIPFQKQVRTYIQIIPTPLVPRVVAFSVTQVTIGLTQSILLQPAVYSFDPDFPDLKNFTIAWRCRMVGESWPTATTPLPLTIGSSGTGCFGNGPGFVANPKLDWNVTGSSFQSINNIYEIEAQVSKPPRTSPVIIQIVVVKGPVPILNVSCASDIICVPTDDGTGVFVNPNVRLGLLAPCIAACDPPLTYNWKATDVSGTPLTFSATDTPIGTSGSEFSLATSFFDANPSVTKFQMTVEALNSAAGGPQKGSATYFIKVNQRPVNGQCSLDHYIGKALVEKFILSCSGWTDPEAIGIELYTVRLVSNGTRSTLTELRQTVDPVQVMPLVMPIGSFTVEVTVQDLWGATTVVTLPQPVLVKTISQTEFVNADSSTLIDNLMGGGDTNMLTMVINSRNSIISQAPFLNVNDPSLNASSKQDLLLLINDMNTQAVNCLKDSMSFQTQGSTEAAAKALADIMLKVSATPDDALTMDLFTRDDIYDIMENMVDKIGKLPIGSPEDLRKLIESVSTIAAGLVISTEEVCTPGCQRIPPRDAITNSLAVDYDTEVKSIDMTIPGDLSTAKQCNMMDITKAGQIVQMPRLMAIMNKMSSYVHSKQVTGESLDVATKNNMTVVSKILPPPGLPGSHYCGSSWIEFPKSLCPQGSFSLPVELSLKEWPTMIYIDSPEADLLTSGTRVLDVDIADRSGNPLPVDYSPDDIKVHLYRTLYKRGNSTRQLYPEFIKATEETQYQKIPIMYTMFNSTKNGSGFTVEITPTVPLNTSLFIMGKKSRLPTLTNYDCFALVADLNKTADGTYIWWLTGDKVNGTGSYYFGVAEFAASVNLTYARKPILGKPDLSWLVKPMTTDYNISIVTSGCYYYDNDTGVWAYDGMKTAAAEVNFVHCTSNHLTSFGGGMFVMPNTIDFSYVFAHMGFADNLTIYVTLIICLSIFVLLMIWARWQDQNDLKKLGAAPLPDNLADDKYLYEILVFTGNQKEAQTDSTVQFILSGDYGDTEVRTFGDSQRSIFRKGDINVFVMAVPKSLGPLAYLDIWHDNSGKGPNASWYLNYIVFRDVQTGRKYEFICNDWLGVEKSDGQIERMIGVAGRDQKSEFGFLFSNTSNKKLTDGHLWFSVFMRPPRSRFTRCQRVGTCFALLFLSMLTNAMWYNTVPQTTTPPGGLSIGPINLNPAQIGVGLMSSLVVFPPSFVIAILFRKSRPDVLRKSRIQEALERASKETMKAKHGEDWDSDEEEGTQQEEAKSKLNRENSGPQRNLVQKKKKKKRFSWKKFTLPWWCKYLSWLVVFACIGVSVFFLLSYGIMFGNDKATKWVSSLFVSFFTSILMIQPIKVILTAMFISLVCKDLDLDEDDADEDEENPELGKDQLWLYEGEKSQRLGYSKIHEEMLAELRRRRLKELEYWDIIYELFGYSTFIWILLVISMGQRDPNGFYLKNSLMNNFIHFGDLNGNDFSQLGTTDDFWNYLPLGLMRPLRADKWYNGVPPYQLRGFLNDYANRIMGYATIRQIRAKKNTCSVPWITRNVVDQCSGFTSLNEEGNNYCAKWAIPDSITKNTSDCNVPEFKYETAAQLQSLPIWGARDWYGGGGYVIHLSGTTQEVLDRFTFLQENFWIDEMTRAVIIEFSTYNSQVNLFGICTLMCEFLPGSGIQTNYRFDAVSLLPSESKFGTFVIACEILFCLFTIYFTLREFRLMFIQKHRYFDSYWSYAELSMLAASYGAILLYFVRDYETNKAVQVFKNTYGNGYVRMTYAVTINEYYGYAISFLVFVGILKFIKVLRFNRRIGFLSETLGKCWEDLIGFMMAFCTCFFSFVFMFYFLIGTVVVDFSNVTGALATCFSMMMGKFQFNEIASANPMAPIMFFIFVLCTSWVLVNLLITLIMKSFQEVKEEILKRPDEYQVVDFVFSQFKKFIGQQAPRFTPQVPPMTTKEIQEKVNNDVADLPDKVDKFLSYVNKVYFNGAMDLKTKDGMKDSLYQPRQILGADDGVGVDRVGFGRNSDHVVSP